MIDFEIHKCPVCGEQFEVACESQLREKLKTHTCPKNKFRTNKKRERTRQLKRAQVALYVQDTVVNEIEETRFQKLIQQGVIV